MCVGVSACVRVCVCVSFGGARSRYAERSAHRWRRRRTSHPAPRTWHPTGIWGEARALSNQGDTAVLS